MGGFAESLSASPSTPEARKQVTQETCDVGPAELGERCAVKIGLRVLVKDREGGENGAATPISTMSVKSWQVIAEFIGLLCVEILVIPDFELRT